MDWNGKPYHSLDYEMKRRFGTKVYKIALDGGMTCPNRDGTLGSRGCIFCSAGRLRRFAAPLPPDMLSACRDFHAVSRQIEEASGAVRRKLGSSERGLYWPISSLILIPMLLFPTCVDCLRLPSVIRT